MKSAVLLLLLLALAVACGPRTRPPPSPDAPSATPPDLVGRTVMVLPVQFPGAADTAHPLFALNGELAYWLGERGSRVRWVLPATMQRALARNPALDIRLEALAVAAFALAEVRNIGDPLYGDLRRLGALVDARYALVPTGAAYVPTENGDNRVELAAALIDTIGGRVLWFGVVAGQPGPIDDVGTVASAAEALARALLR